jgi:hypothetical protein
VTERDQLLHHLIVQLTREPTAFSFLRGAECGNVGVLATQSLLGVRAEDVDRAAQILDHGIVAHWLALSAQVAMRHALSMPLQRTQDLGIHENLIHVSSITHSV